MLVTITLLCIMLATLPASAPEKEMPASDESAVRELLNAIEFKQEERDELAKLGGYSPAAFSLYIRILDDPKENANMAARTLLVLSKIKADRSQFLERVVAMLAHSRSSVRQYAVELLAQIGSERDAAPIVALLWDEAWEIPFAAANTLVAIGDRRSLTAMDVWLNSSIHYADAAGYAVQRKHVIKCREQLKARLDEAKAKKP